MSPKTELKNPGKYDAPVYYQYSFDKKKTFYSTDYYKESYQFSVNENMFNLTSYLLDCPSPNIQSLSFPTAFQPSAEVTFLPYQSFAIISGSSIILNWFC